MLLQSTHELENRLRIIFWPVPDGKSLLLTFAFDKKQLGDIWYDRAIKESEATVDLWLREDGSL